MTNNESDNGCYCSRRAQSHQNNLQDHMSNLDVNCWGVVNNMKKMMEEEEKRGSNEKKEGGYASHNHNC